jgi:RimJ/RimL family protein N-acetyltransferase
MEVPVIKRDGYTLRPWESEDAASLVKHANNHRVARNLRDGFPYPYTLRDAQFWLDGITGNREDLILAIEVNGEAAGGIGIHHMKDVYRYNGEIGYWLSEYHWGKGIMTDAVGTVVEHAFIHSRWLRIFAAIFENNQASMKVLEKNGFELEAIHKRTVMKEGVVMDEYLYALLKERWQAFRSKEH